MVIIAFVFNASSGVSIRILLTILGDFQINVHPTVQQIELGRALIESLMFLLFASVIVASNPDFILLTISFAFILGTTTYFTLQMAYFIPPFDHSLKDQSNLVLVCVIA
ncbi:unnamed protein product (macronuclear) [Paramecium tetraurelia]|uniref:Solute carrier family 40 protein n=1 Tax=Paramecium tetraurelia TaxID=5888 RepID=A0CKB3_PARTE|nr:uncharacterized protein GSPATT00000943001 [Paramecium tetraurelia]CAK71230.1 unnamed protein product [Paramecium tetraurelia]|eukprot:XP_001438627.1 hypothetical protein (macronuclear) [Paramecium tetraurelia strain d4-2]